MNRQTPIILAAIFLGFILTHDTAIAWNILGMSIGRDAATVASMHSAHAAGTAQDHHHLNTSLGCDVAPAIVNDACVTSATANSLRPDGDGDAVPHDVCTLTPNRDPQLPWAEICNVHTLSGTVRRALLQVYRN